MNSLRPVITDIAKSTALFFSSVVIANYYINEYKLDKELKEYKCVKHESLADIMKLEKLQKKEMI